MRNGKHLARHIDREFPLGPDLLRGIDLWSVWSKLSCPMRVAEFEGVGHALALMSREQIAAVKEFLLE